MSSESENEENDKLFETDDSQPIVFYFRPCAARARLQSIIEGHGGKVTAKYTDNAIKLANDDDYLTANDYISARYIEDCVKANKLLDREKYKLKMKQIVIRENSNDVSDFSSDEEVEHKIRVQSRHLVGRKRYTKEEDMEILKYIMEEKYRYREVSGTCLWRDMELLKITNHSASSMNTHFRKYIVKNMNLYHIPITWKKRFNPSYAESESPLKKQKCLESAAAEKTDKKGCTDPASSSSNMVIDDVDDLEDDFDRDLLSKVHKTSTQKDPTPKNPKSPTSNGKEFVTDLDDLSSDESEESEPQQMSDECVSSSVPDVDPENVKDICRFVRETADVYDLSETAVLHLLWVNNGDVTDTLNHIVKGKKPNGMLPWDPADDHKINTNIQDLNEKYGEDIVKDRLLFLEGL